MDAHASGSVRSPFGRARGQSRHLNDQPILSPERRNGQKNTLDARDRDRPDISRHRKRWRFYQGLIDHRRLVFTKPRLRGGRLWTRTNMTRLRGLGAKGPAPVDKVPQGNGRSRLSSPPYATTASTRPACSTGPSTASASFAYVDQVLDADAEAGRRRDPRQSWLPQGKGGAQGDPGCRSPPRLPAEHFPDLNPIEPEPFAPFKTLAAKGGSKEATRRSPTLALKSSPITCPPNGPHTSKTHRYA